MVIHNIERKWGFGAFEERGGLQLQGTRWPLVTNYQVIIPARLMSEVSVITRRQETCCYTQATKVWELFNPCAVQNLTVKFILPLWWKKKRIPLLPVEPSYCAHRLFFTHGGNCKPHWTDVPIEGFLLLWAILPSWNQTQNLSLSPL